MSNIIENSKVKLKTYTFYINDKRIFDYMTTISKNIYNRTLYCYKVYKQFEDNIYKDLYDDIIKNNKGKIYNKVKNKDNTGKREKKDNIIIQIEEKLYKIYNDYYNLYSLNKKNLFEYK